VVRGAAAAGLAAAIAVPLLRRKLKIPPAVTATALAAGPPSLAVVGRRTRLRDAGMYALQMWMFTMGHELPYDDPDAARRRLRIRYPIRVDRFLGAGELPNVRLQRALAGLGRRNVLDRALSWIHWTWFLEPHGSLTWILARHPEHFARSARQMSAVFDIGCAVYMAAPTAPPWWASEQGYTDAKVRRIMQEVGEEEWGRAWPVLYDALGGNPWAAMPSLHFATSLMAALLLAETGPTEGALGWAYAGTLGFALVYLGEHYVIDLLTAVVIVIAVRRGERYVDPVAQAISRGLQRLERIANPTPPLAPTVRERRLRTSQG
jgi:membrane-associated phospholipid phosphatase